MTGVGLKWDRKEALAENTDARKEEAPQSGAIT